MTTELVERARGEAMRRYASAHEEWAEREHVLLLEGRDIEAEGAHQMGLAALRAWLAEKEEA